MVRIVISIVLLLALCVLVVLNLNYATPLNIFWVIFDRVSVVAVGLVTFVSGVLYSFFLYASRYVAGVRKNALINRRRELDRRESEAAAGESQVLLQGAQEPAASDATTPQQGAETKPRGKRHRR